MASAKKKSIQKSIANPNHKVNDIVFAKLRGFTTWPAQIHDIQKNRYTVLFFGSYDW